MWCKLRCNNRYVLKISEKQLCRSFEYYCILQQAANELESGHVVHLFAMNEGNLGDCI